MWPLNNYYYVCYKYIVTHSKLAVRIIEAGIISCEDNSTHFTNSYWCMFHSVFVATPLSGRPLAVLGVNCRHILLYNLGIQQLFSGHPLAAFDSLLEVVQVYHANPRLWLRLAEASISAYTKVGQSAKVQGDWVVIIVKLGILIINISYVLNVHVLISPVYYKVTTIIIITVVRYLYLSSMFSPFMSKVWVG